MSQTRTVKKSKGGVQDLLLGKGTVNQDRAGGTYTIDKLDVPVALDTVAEMQALDTVDFTRARVYSAVDEYIDYVFDEADNTGIKPDTGPGSWRRLIPEGTEAELTTGAEVKQRWWSPRILARWVVQLFMRNVETIADLRNLEPLVGGQQINLLGHTYPGVGGGLWYFDALDTSSPDNNITVAVTPSGARWKRPDVREIPIEWGGLDNTGNTDDSALMQAVVNLNYPMTIGSGDFVFDNIAQPPSMSNFVIRGVTSRGRPAKITGSEGYQGYILNVTRNYDIRGIFLEGGYLDGQYGIGADEPGNGGGRVVLDNLDFRQFDQAIRFGTEYEHPIGLKYSNIYVQFFRTAGINLAGTSGGASSGESCWSFDDVLTPNTGAVPVTYPHTVQANTPNATRDTVSWTGSIPEFGFIVLRSLDGATGWHIPPNWTSDSYTSLSFEAEKLSGETWIYTVLRMTVGCNLRRGKIVNIGAMQNEYTGIGLRLDDIQGCNIGAHYYEIRNSKDAQGGFAGITTSSAEATIQTCRSEEAGYNVYVGDNSKVDVQLAVSNAGTIAVFGNGGSTSQLLTYGSVTQGSTPAIYNAPNNGANDYNYDGLQLESAALKRTTSHVSRPEHEFQVRGVKVGSIYADSKGMTAELNKLELKLNNKSMTPLVVNAIGKTPLTDGVATEFLNIGSAGTNGSGSLRFHYKIVVFDSSSVTRQTQSGFLNVDSINVSSATPTAIVSSSDDQQVLSANTLTTAFTASVSAGNISIACNANSTYASPIIRIELTPISLIGNLENVVQT